MLKLETEEYPMESCIVCTSVTADEIYRREHNIARRFINFFVSMFIEE